MSLDAANNLSWQNAAGFMHKYITKTTVSITCVIIDIASICRRGKPFFIPNLWHAHILLKAMK